MYFGMISVLTAQANQNKWAPFTIITLYSYLSFLSIHMRKPIQPSDPMDQSISSYRLSVMIKACAFLIALLSRIVVLAGSFLLIVGIVGNNSKILTYSISQLIFCGTALCVSLRILTRKSKHIITWAVISIIYGGFTLIQYFTKLESQRIIALLGAIPCILWSIAGLCLLNGGRDYLNNCLENGAKTSS